MKIGPVLSIFWEKIGPNVIYLALKNAMLSIFGRLNWPLVVYFFGKNCPCYLFWVLSLKKICSGYRIVKTNFSLFLPFLLSGNPGRYWDRLSVFS